MGHRGQVMEMGFTLDHPRPLGEAQFKQWLIEQSFNSLTNEGYLIFRIHIEDQTLYIEKINEQTLSRGRETMTVYGLSPLNGSDHEESPVFMHTHAGSTGAWATTFPYTKNLFTVPQVFKSLHKIKDSDSEETNVSVVDKGERDGDTQVDGTTPERGSETEGRSGGIIVDKRTGARFQIHSYPSDGETNQLHITQLKTSDGQLIEDITERPGKLQIKQLAGSITSDVTLSLLPYPLVLSTIISIPLGAIMYELTKNLTDSLLVVGATITVAALVTIPVVFGFKTLIDTFNKTAYANHLGYIEHLLNSRKSGEEITVPHRSFNNMVRFYSESSLIIAQDDHEQ